MNIITAAALFGLFVTALVLLNLWHSAERRKMTPEECEREDEKARNEPY